MWVSMSGVATLFILIIVGWFIYKKCLKNSRKHETTNTFCHYDNIREQIHLPAFDTTISSTTTDTTIENDNGTRFSVKNALTP